MLFFDYSGSENTLTALDLILIASFLGSLLHVFIEAGRIGESLLQRTLIVMMVALVVWPLGYLLWIGYWPGSFRKWLAKKLKAAHGKASKA